MSLTNKEIIERVQSLYSRGVASDDTRMSKRLIYSSLCSNKSLIIRRELDKKRKVSDFNFDYLECVPMKKAEPYECPCAPPSGCKIMKSECKIPETVTYKGGHYIASVSSIDGSTTYSKTTWETKRFKVGARYTKSTPDYFIKDGYLYITTPSDTKAVTVKGVFQSIADFSCNVCDETTTETCKSYLDKPFNIEPDLIDMVVTMTYEQLVKPFLITPQDEQADSRDR